MNSGNREARGRRPRRGLSPPSWVGKKGPFARGAGAARADAAVCARADPVHARHRRPAQGQVRNALRRAVRRWRRPRRIQAHQPPVGAAREDRAERRRRADCDGRPPVLRAPRHRLQAHGGGAAQHPDGRPAGRLDHHAATRAQPLSGGDRPRGHPHAEDQGSDHGAQDRGGLHQARDPRDVSQHRAVSVQRLRHRDGGAHLFRQVRRRAGRAGGRHAHRHAQGHQRVQPRAASRSAHCSAATSCSRRWRSTASSRLRSSQR